MLNTKEKIIMTSSKKLVLIITLFLILLIIFTNTLILYSSPNSSENSGEIERAIHTSTSILEGVKQCYSEGVSLLIVESGNYDIIQEYLAYYGNDYFENYIDYWGEDPFARGIWLENIEIRFSPGAKVSCHYTGNNENVIFYFSAFAAGNNVIIDGLVLDTSNIRYSIHPDFNTGKELSTMILRNCELQHFKSETNQQAVGAGLGHHVDWKFENCIFYSDYQVPVVRIHNNGNDNVQSKVTFTDCYIEGPGYFLFNAYGPSIHESLFIVTGCSYTNKPIVSMESLNADTTNPDNVILLEYNNELREE